MKINLLRNGELTLLFTDVDKSGPKREFLTWQVVILKLFAKISEFTVDMKNHQMMWKLCSVNRFSI